MIKQYITTVIVHLFAQVSQTINNMIYLVINTDTIVLKNSKEQNCVNWTERLK